MSLVSSYRTTREVRGGARLIETSYGGGLRYCTVVGFYGGGIGRKKFLRREYFHVNNMDAVVRKS